MVGGHNLKARELELVVRESTLSAVIPAEAGIQSFAIELKSSLDAGVRRHDNRGESH